MDVKGASAGSMHILMVEDSAEDFELIVHELRGGGLEFSAKRVDIHEELMRELDARKPSLVLCDHGTARLDSLVVFNLVRARFAALPFIVVTGSPDARAVTAVLERGADECVLKHRLGELVPAVRRALRQSELRQLLEMATTERDHLRAQLFRWRNGRPVEVPICAGCKRIRDSDNEWRQLEWYFYDHFDVHFSHCLCPDCVRQYAGGMR